MTFSFPVKPMSDEEINNVSLLAPGEYDFFLEDFQLATSKKGNPMLELKIKIIDNQKEHTITDYLVNTAASQYKIKNYCYAVGLENRYNAGDLQPDRSWLKLRGRCKVDIQEGLPKTDKITGQLLPGGERWPSKNCVSDYIRDAGKEADGNIESMVPAHMKEQFDDEIPF